MGQAGRAAAGLGTLRPLGCLAHALLAEGADGDGDLPIAGGEGDGLAVAGADELVAEALQGLGPGLVNAQDVAGSVAPGRAELGDVGLDEQGQVGAVGAAVPGPQAGVGVGEQAFAGAQLGATEGGQLVSGGEFCQEGAGGRRVKLGRAVARRELAHRDGIDQVAIGQLAGRAASSPATAAGSPVGARAWHSASAVTPLRLPE